MFDLFMDLPVHILIVHAVVMGVPAACLATAAIAVRSGWRERIGWWVVALDAATVGFTFVARESGEHFYAALGDPENAVHHRALGLNLIWFVAALFAVSVLLMAFARVGGIVFGGVALLTLAVAAAAVFQVALVGHTGSEAVWKGSVTSSR